MYMDYDDEVISSQAIPVRSAREDPERPFLLTVSMIQPHDPTCVRSIGISIAMMKLTCHGFHSSVEEDPHSARLRFSYGASELDLRKKPSVMPVTYYGSISDIDDRVGNPERT